MDKKAHDQKIRELIESNVLNGDGNEENSVDVDEILTDLVCLGHKKDVIRFLKNCKPNKTNELATTAIAIAQRRNDQEMCKILQEYFYGVH
jgi:hypothetical protein